MKKRKIILTNKEKESYEKQTICYICKKEFSTDKKNCKVRDHDHFTGDYRGAAHSICNLRYKIPKEIPIVFHNGSTYDYHFIIKRLAKEFKGNFECLGESTEKYITFSVPIKKEHDNGKTTIYKLKFFDSYRFMQNSLSSLVDNLSEIDNKNTMIDLLTQSINKISQIDQKIAQIDKKKEPENKFIDSMRSMIYSWKIHYQILVIIYLELIIIKIL